MDGYEELLIGFDARERFLKFKDIWDTHRIEQYLLREDIIKPLSVDVMVWDSVFHVLQVEPLDWRGPRQEWDSLERLKAVIERENINRSYWLVATSQWTTAEKKNALEKLYGIIPASPSHEWNLLGFDIADELLLSGLMNAGYGIEQREILSQQWARHLNQYHLFEDLDIALKFKSLTDERVKEHSPFSVYGIYLIEKVTASESVSNSSH